MSPIVIIVLAVVLILAIIAIGFGLLRGDDSGDRATRDRLDRFVSDFERPETQITSEGADDGSSTRLAQNIDEAIGDRGFAQRISTELARANLRITVTEYILLVIGCMVAFGALMFLVYRGNPVMALLGCVVGFFVPRIYLGVRKARRLRAFNDQLGDTITLMANGLRSGYSLLMAMESVGSEMPDPIAGEFGRVVREISLGVSNERAMNNMHRRIDSDDLELMITAINVQHEVGGNLAEILDIIGFVIRERVRITGEIKTLTAQGMMSGYIVSFLPIALGLILFAMNQEYIGRMVFPNSTQPCGWIMMGIGFIMIALGFTAIMKIVKIDI